MLKRAGRAGRIGLPGKAGSYTPPSPSAPANLSTPVVTGDATQGATLSCAPGNWSGYPAPAFTYQWQRGGVNIGGATASTYATQLADVGAAVRCVVTATNGSGSLSANSNAINVVAAGGGATARAWLQNAWATGSWRAGAWKA